MPVNDGGPAFPVHEPIEFIQADGCDPAPYKYGLVGGLTKRDWFAGMALQALIGGNLYGPRIYSVNQGNVTAAYEYADAMLTAREKEQP